MATAQQRSRKQLRHSVGQLSGKAWMDAGAIESAPSETAPSAGKIIDQNLEFGADDEHRGKWVFATDSNSSTEIRRVRASSPSERSVTVSVPFSRAPDTSWTYELWESELSPTVVHEFIDQAITEATRKGSVPLTSDSFHTGGNVRAWGLSSTIAGIRFVQWRRSYTGEQLTSLDDAMTAGANATVITDSEDKKEGSAAASITIAAAASSAETLASDSFAAVNMRGYTNVQFWVKSNVDLTSSNLRIQLNEGSTNRETLALPALNADSWTLVDVTLANPELDSAITRFVPQTGASDGGSATVKFDDVVTYRARAEEWVTIPREFWKVDRDRRELVLTADARVPYARLQVTGVQKPSLLTSDTQILSIDPGYVVNAVLAKTFRLLDERGQADRYEALAQQQRVRMNTPSGIVWIDD